MVNKAQNIKNRKKMEKYSNLYKELNSQLEKFTAEFDKNPCSKTAKKVSDVRVKINALSYEQKYTPEFNKQWNDMMKADWKEINLKTCFL